MKRRIMGLCLVGGVSALLILVGAGCENKGGGTAPTKPGGNGPVPGSSSYPGGGGPGGGAPQPPGGGSGGPAPTK